jgi:hypothetical protein
MDILFSDYSSNITVIYIEKPGRFFGLVVRVPGYRSWGPDSISGATRLSLLNTIEELLGRKCSGSGLEIREYGLGIRHADYRATSIRKSWH